MRKLQFFQLIIAFLFPLFSMAETAPESDGGFKYAGGKDYRDRNPGLGQSWRFESEYGWADEFAYDMNSDWKDGITPQLKDHVKKYILKDFESTKQQGAYKSFKIVSTDDETIGGVKFVRMKLEIVHDDGKKIESYMYLTAINGELLKFRISLYTPVTAKAKKAMAEFLKVRVAANKKKGSSIPKGAFGFKYEATDKAKDGVYYTFESGKNRVVEFFGGKAGTFDEAYKKYLGGDIMYYSNEQDKGVYKTVVISKLEETEICSMKFMEARLRIESPEGEKWTGLAIFATNLDGKVLKFMIFTPEPTERKALKDAEDFMEFRIKGRAKS